MAVVYRATDPALDRTVALKVLHPHLADRADSRERFTREARAVARLAHPHIVEVYDYATPESKQAYIVTEFIDGPTLRAFVEAHPIRHGEAAALLMVPVLEALDHAHRAGIVHRDVKPENIMLRSDGSPVLMDFGIAQMIDMETLTKTGMMLGSPAHMAPEVVEGEDLTTLADVFSVGTVLYWLVCGSLPFTGPNPAALFRRILECQFDPVLALRPAAGRPLARLIERSLAKDGAARPQTAGEVARALRDLLSDAGIHDVRQELADFTRDPEVYQDDLARRLVPTYLAAAIKAHEARATARALDFLDRVLGLDETHPEARALLARIERGRRRVVFVRVAAAAVVLVGVIALMQSLPVTPSVFPEPPPPTPTRPPPSPVTVLPVVDAGVAVAPPPAVVDARVPDARRVARTRRRRPLRPVVIERPPDAAVPLGVSNDPARMRVAFGVFKAARLLVDGRFEGTASQIEARGGVKLTVGKHRVEIRNPPCRALSKTIRVEPWQAGNKLPDYTFVCYPTPATLRISSNLNAPVRRLDGRILGRTNQDIRVGLKKDEVAAQLDLIVGDPTAKTQRLAVHLSAGARTEKTVRF